MGYTGKVHFQSLVGIVSKASTLLTSSCLFQESANDFAFHEDRFYNGLSSWKRIDIGKNTNKVW